MLALTFTDDTGGDISTSDLLAPAAAPDRAASIRESVIIALTTDARADTADIDDNANPRGFWASDIGSLLWVLKRQVISDALLRQMENTARAALEKIPLIVQSVTAERARGNANAVILQVAANDQQIQIQI